MLDVDTTTPSSPLSKQRSTLYCWLRSWELPLVLTVIAAIAGFLRFYQISTTEFDEDQAMLFRLAQDALHHGLLPATSNAASIGIANPPGAIYFFMPIALFSTNPVWGAVLVGAGATVAAILTYLFTRRYYGTLAGCVAALLYATAARPLIYARFIWQPNLMPPFVVLFLFTLFLGVVERRKGWFLPALGLLGVLYQLHPTTLLLVLPLTTAILLSPGTVRWRDLVLAAALLLLIFFPYVIWEFFTHFADLSTASSFAKQHASLDNQALLFYWNFLNPYDHYPTYPTSVLRMVAPWISWLRHVVLPLALGGSALAGMQLFRGRKAPEVHLEGQHSSLPMHRVVIHGWQRLRADPYRCGLLVLLVWQIGPLLILTRHAVDLHSQYFFMLMPGPFILIGLFAAWVVKLSRLSAFRSEQYMSWRMWVRMMLRYPLPALVTLILVAQFVGSMAMVVDQSSGNFDDRSFQPYPYHNALSSLQHALREADTVARHYHVKRVYITTDAATQTALRYLSNSMQTPTTLFDASRCLLLPNPADGPALLLVGPYNPLTTALLNHFASFTVVDRPARLGGSPFSLYLVTPRIAPSKNTAPAVFLHHLQLTGGHAQPLQVGNSSWLVTDWTLLHSEPPQFRTLYNYALQTQTLTSDGHMQESLCTFTTLSAGDQLLVAFAQAQRSTVPLSMTIQGTFFATVPYNPSYGPFHLETDKDQNVSNVTLSTVEGKKSISVPTG